MLDGKVAFITGGASGIGEGTVRRFAQQGARVALADAQDEAGERIRHEAAGDDGRALYVHCDLCDPASVRAAIERTVQEFGRLDIVFANAGINGVLAPIDELQTDEWNTTLAINLTGAYLTVHYGVPHLKRAGAGSIIITSSVNGPRTFSNPGASAYSTSKAGQVAFMKMIAPELGRHNI
jgi:NAD(P)-dependent dehydrogenase (short-subunit alcohol dehydrogenase family)